jgi:uncharacterized protein (UPF0548 family)
MLFLLRPESNVIEQLLLRRRDMSFSYSFVGATRATPPAGWRINHRRECLGAGRAIHERAVAALFSWTLLAVSGIEVVSPAPKVEPQADLALLSPHFGIWSVDFCRVIYVLRGAPEDNGAVERTGFGYGTLPGHAVKGEERFSIEWHSATEEVWYDIYSFSQPSSLLVRVLAPVVRAAQRRFARDSLARAAAIASNQCTSD